MTTFKDSAQGGHPMIAYDPRNQNDRKILATAIVAKLTESGFTEESIPGCNERVFSREPPTSPGIRVAVWTSVEGDEARACATDALRVTLLYKTKTGTDRGLAKNVRVNRTGTIEAIIDRMLTRMRNMWTKATRTIEANRCPSCNAPMFTSKIRKDGSGGNLVCADVCWTKNHKVA